MLLSVSSKRQCLSSPSRAIMMPMKMSSASHSSSHFSLTTHLTIHETSSPENSKFLNKFKHIHLAIVSGYFSDPVVQTRVIRLCCAHELGDMNYARKVFDAIPEPTLYMWNTMIKGYSDRGCSVDALSIYQDMLQRHVCPDTFSYPCLLKGFRRDNALEHGKVLHSHIVKFGYESNMFVQNALIHAYSLCGLMEFASRILESSTKRDVMAWNAVISGYNRNKRFEESRKIFYEMEKESVLPTSVTFISILSACSKLKDLETGKWVHQRLKNSKVEPNMRLENALADMYAASGEMESALRVFENMKNRDVISWTIIVKGFAGSGQIDQAKYFFDQMPEKDLVSWTAMIDGYLQVNRFKEALVVFRAMQRANLKPDGYTMVSILRACAHLGALELGEWIKTYIDKYRIKIDVFVGNALIDMYFKCGNVDKALKVFKEMHSRDRFTWTATIVGLAVNGHGTDALDMFSQMLKASISPDEITYVGVLCACTHNGMVDEGRNFFANMISQCGIDPKLAHYGCMVDLLGRAGRLQEAYEVIKKMPIKANSIVWGALLGACRVHKNSNMAETAAKRLLELDPENDAVYVSLCNVYAACNRYENMRELRKVMKDKGITKTPGCSTIEMNSFLHEFVAGDRSHPQSKEIYSTLDEVTRDLKFAGYLPDTSELFLNSSVEEKESMSAL